MMIPGRQKSEARSLSDPAPRILDPGFWLLVRTDTPVFTGDTPLRYTPKALLHTS